MTYQFLKADGTCCDSAQSDYITYIAADEKFKVKMSSTWEAAGKAKDIAGPKTIRYKAFLNDDAVTSLGTSFTLTLVDPCLTSTMTTETWPDMTTTVKVATGAVSITKNGIKDAASTTYANNDGLTLCGNRKYTISGTYAHNTLTTPLYSKPVTISLVTTLDAHITHPTNGVTEVVTACLQDYTTAQVPCI